MSLQTELGEIIKQIRSIKGLTQDQLAEILGVSQSAIVKYERNLSKPGMDFIKKFKKETGYDLTAENITSVIKPASEPIEEVERVLQETGSDIESRRSLERTLENLSEDKKESTAIIKRLVTLLEKQFNSSSPGPADQEPEPKDKRVDLPSGEGRIGLGKKKGQVNR